MRMIHCAGFIVTPFLLQRLLGSLSWRPPHERSSAISAVRRSASRKSFAYQGFSECLHSHSRSAGIFYLHLVAFCNFSASGHLFSFFYRR
uniref:Secreted protein n=1 Tax=Parascaris univalens TaxID=6257 RepID=A0A914ZD46_PARUN